MVWYGMVWYGMVWYGMYVCIYIPLYWLVTRDFPIGLLEFPIYWVV